jgi:multidrug efflux system membrane fusion protein
MLQTIKRYPFALSVPIFILFLWLWLKPNSPSAHDHNGVKDKSPFKVMVLESHATSKSRTLSLMGRTDASRTTNLQAETVGTAEHFFVKEGDRVSDGTLCVKMNEGDRREKVASAKAAVTEKETRYKISKKLLEKKYRSAIDVAVDYAAWQKALSTLKQAELDLSYTEIRAPFAGVVKKIFAEKGEMLPPLSREPVLQIVSLDPLVVVGHINEAYRPHITLGQPADLSWGELGSEQGTVSFIDPVADESTHTFKIKVAVDNPDHAILGGLTTTITLPLGTVQAHEIRTGSLVLSDQGVQGVYAVNDCNRVHFYPVEIIDSSEDTVWVANLPSSLSLVVVGQGFIKEGEVVAPSPFSEKQ